MKKFVLYLIIFNFCATCRTADSNPGDSKVTNIEGCPWSSGAENLGPTGDGNCGKILQSGSCISHNGIGLMCEQKDGAYQWRCVNICGGITPPGGSNPPAPGGGSNPARPKTGRFGVNVMHLLDSDVYKNNVEKQVETLNYINNLGAKFVRVTAGYKHDQPNLATAYANRLCELHRRFPGVQYLVAISEKTLAGHNQNDYQVIQAWNQGQGKNTDHWKFTEKFVSVVNSNCPTAIFAWQAGNEILCRECTDGPKNDASFIAKRKEYQNFLINYNKALAGIKSSGMIGLGIVRAGWATFVRENGMAQEGFDKEFWRTVYSQASINYISIHPYGHHNASDEPMSHEKPWQFAPDVQLAHELGKPIIMEEFGAAPHYSGEHGRDTYTAQRLEAILSWINWAKANGVAWIAPYAGDFIPDRTGLSWFGGSCSPTFEGNGDRCILEKALRSF
ncbi:MAG: hypothetical protein KBD78_12410 [Oligoflexales bacterium]|nr:hypothetical protein [Oligoflexales bacterium]